MKRSRVAAVAGSPEAATPRPKRGRTITAATIQAKTIQAALVPATNIQAALVPATNIQATLVPATNIQAALIPPEFLIPEIPPAAVVGLIPETPEQASANRVCNCAGAAQYLLNNIMDVNLDYNTIGFDHGFLTGLSRAIEAHSLNLHDECQALIESRSGDLPLAVTRKFSEIRGKVSKGLRQLMNALGLLDMTNIYVCSFFLFLVYLY
jgi:hypothetical protein